MTIYMSLENQIKTVLDDFDHTTSEKIFDILNQIMPHFKSKLISEYLQGKILKIQNIEGEQDRLKQCEALKPYFDWYLQGL